MTTKGECFDCELEGFKCPNNRFPEKRLEYLRCSCNTQYCDTLDKFIPKNK
jgi:hypothetical protein